MEPSVETKVSFTCNCGNEIEMMVEPQEEYEVKCEKCGQDYRFIGASLLRG